MEWSELASQIAKALMPLNRNEWKEVHHWFMIECEKLANEDGATKVYEEHVSEVLRKVLENHSYPKKK